MRGFNGAVVIDENEGALVVGVGVALRALVARAEVAFWVVGWKGGFGGGFLLASCSC